MNVPSPVDLREDPPGPSPKPPVSPPLDPARAVALAFSERATRRDGDRELPLGPKAQRTRATILEAAQRVFTENGYLRTSIGDIAAEAGVSLGTVYQYFRDRSDLVAALVQRSVVRMLQRTDVTWRVEEGVAGLERVLLNFVSAYSEAAPMARVWEEVCFVEPDLAALRRALGRLFTASVERELERTVDLRDSRLEPSIAARALAGMVDRYCYMTYVFDPDESATPTPEESARVLTRIWAGGVGIDLP